jgi:hypothetical protein
MSIATGHRGPLALSDEAARLLRARIGRARSTALAAGARAVASVTMAVPAGLDLSAAVLAARREDDDWFCFEQPERCSSAGLRSRVPEARRRSGARSRRSAWSSPSCRWRAAMARLG